MNIRRLTEKIVGSCTPIRLGLYPCRTLPRNAAIDWLRDHRLSRAATTPLMLNPVVVCDKEQPSQTVK